MAASAEEPGRREVRLPGGGRLTVRAVGPPDVDGLVALYDGLSDDDRYRRFFSGFRPPRAFFERLAAVADRGGYGVVAVVEGARRGAADEGGAIEAGAAGIEPGRIVGEASYELLPNGDGELGITVAADQRGWLGPFLLDALVEAAAARGVPDLEADVLVTNRRMLALLRSRGDASLGSNDWSMVRLLVGTAGHAPAWPGGSGPDRRPDRRRVLVEVPGGRWHAQAEAEAVGLDVVACPGPTGARRRRCPVLAGRPCPLASAADVVVASNVPDDEDWSRVVSAHDHLHPGVPVCVERRARPAGSGAGPAVPGAVTVDDDRGTHEVVALVDRLASEHRRRAGRPPSAPPGGDVRP